MISSARLVVSVAGPGSKRSVEIISGRDRRLQGEGEETGPRLQRDRSGVSEMEPLPAAQDALRLELRPAEAWNCATLRLCRRSCRGSAPNDGRSLRTSLSSSSSSSSQSSCSFVSSGQLSRVAGMPPPADFTPITFGKSRGDPSEKPPHPAWR